MAAGKQYVQQPQGRAVYAFLHSAHISIKATALKHKAPALSAGTSQHCMSVWEITSDITYCTGCIPVVYNPMLWILLDAHPC